MDIGGVFSDVMLGGGWDTGWGKALLGAAVTALGIKLKERADNRKLEKEQSFEVEQSDRGFERNQQALDLQAKRNKRDQAVNILREFILHGNEVKAAIDAYQRAYPYSKHMQSTQRSTQTAASPAGASSGSQGQGFFFYFNQDDPRKIVKEAELVIDNTLHKMKSLLAKIQTHARSFSGDADRIYSNFRGYSRHVDDEVIAFDEGAKRREMIDSFADKVDRYEETPID